MHMIETIGGPFRHALYVKHIVAASERADGRTSIHTTDRSEWISDEPLDAFLERMRWPEAQAKRPSGKAA